MNAHLRIDGARERRRVLRASRTDYAGECGETRMAGDRTAHTVGPMSALCGTPTAALVGLTALAFSALYLVSDIIEALQGGFSGGQLGLTLIAEAAIPVFVIGLYLVQRPQIGRLGQLSAAAYAYSYVFFTGTVVYALADGTSDYTALSHDLQPWMTIHGAVMVLAGLGFGVAVIRAKVLPRWTAVALMAGVVLVGTPPGRAPGVAPR
jgi:hypothetical protein